MADTEYKYFVVFKTNSYAGNFSREMLAYVIGVDEDEEGIRNRKETSAFTKETSFNGTTIFGDGEEDNNPFVDKLDVFHDEWDVFHSIEPYGPACNNVRLHLLEPLDEKLRQLVVTRAEKYFEKRKVTLKEITFEIHEIKTEVEEEVMYRA